MIEVIKVENKGLKMTDGTVIPVFVATLSNYSGEQTPGNQYALAHIVADKAVGMVSGCGYFVRKQSSQSQYDLVSSLSTDETYGDNTGFSLRVTRTDLQGLSAESQFTIYYKDTAIAVATVYTGYSDFEVDLPIIFVDENNNLLMNSDAYSAMKGINYRGDAPFPLALHDDKFLVTHYNGENPVNIGYRKFTLYSTHDNMDDYMKDPGDPWDDGDGGDDSDSQPGGGAGGCDQDNWDPDSDQVPEPSLPTLSAVDTGFITLFNPTVSQLQNLANYLWSGLFDVDSFRKIVANPMDTILGLSIVPVNVPSSMVSEVKVGNIGTGVNMLKANSQYVKVDCGSIAVHEKHHGYLDYAPYTKVSIFLPFIGTQELSIDEIEGTTVSVKYSIDILNGACTAFILIDGNVIYQFSGQCSVSIPITANDFTQTIMALGQLVAGGATSLAGAVASGGLSAPVSAAMIGGAVKAAAGGAMNVVNSKPIYQKSGNLSGSNGLLGVKFPYLIFERPRICKPANQQSYTGFPSYITRSLNVLHGFTQVMDAHLNGIPCTDSEIDEIMRLLREGVIL